VSAVYKNLVSPSAPIGTLKKYERVFKLFIDFGTLNVITINDKEALISTKDFDAEFEPFYHLVSG